MTKLSLLLVATLMVQIASGDSPFDPPPTSSELAPPLPLTPVAPPSDPVPVESEGSEPIDLPSVLVAPESKPLIPVEIPSQSSSTIEPPAEPFVETDPLPDDPLVIDEASPVDFQTSSSLAADPTTLLAEARGESSSTTGDPLSLLDALAHPIDREDRAKAIAAYWSLSSDLAAQGWAMSRWQFLNDLTLPTDLVDQQRLAARVDIAEAQWRESEIAALEAQHELRRAAMIPSNAPLPIPSDAPLVIPYHTRFDLLFADREAPASLARIDQIMPYRLALIESRTSAVAKAGSAIESQVQAYDAGRIPIDDLFDAIDSIEQQQEALLRDVLAYNLDIATYALSVASAGVDRASLVAMLIDFDPPVQSVPANVGANLAGQEPLSRTEPLIIGQSYPSPLVHPISPTSGVIPTQAVETPLHVPTPTTLPVDSGIEVVSPLSPRSTDLLTPAENGKPSAFREITPLQEEGEVETPDVNQATPAVASLPRTLPTTEELPPIHYDGMRSILIRR